MARPTLNLPDLPKLPDKIPGEAKIGRGVDKILNIMERDPLLKAVNALIEKIPIVPEKTFSTPLGTYKTPEFYLPKLTPARMDIRQREAFKAAVVVDISSVIDMIPGVGALAGVVANSMADTADAKIHETLNAKEDDYFTSYDKADPLSTIALMRAFIRTEKEQ